MSYSSTPQNSQSVDVVHSGDSLPHLAEKDLSPEMMRLGIDGSETILRIISEHKHLQDIEETKRREIEIHYRERMEKYSRDLDILAKQMRKQSKSEKDHMDNMFALANRMLDEGFPEASVHIYEIFINDSKRKNLMDYFIDYHERITLGKIKLQKESLE